MLASPLTASKRKAGSSEESVLGVRESGIWFTCPPTTAGVGLRVGMEDTPSSRQKTRQGSLQEKSFILGGGLAGIASLHRCHWEEDVANIHTSYNQDFDLVISAENCINNITSSYVSYSYFDFELKVTLLSSEPLLSNSIKTKQIF